MCNVSFIATSLPFVWYWVSEHIVFSVYKTACADHGEVIRAWTGFAGPCCNSQRQHMPFKTRLCIAMQLNACACVAPATWW